MGLRDVVQVIGLVTGQGDPLKKKEARKKKERWKDMSRGNEQSNQNSSESR